MEEIQIEVLKALLELGYEGIVLSDIQAEPLTADDSRYVIYIGEYGEEFGIWDSTYKTFID